MACKLDRVCDFKPSKDLRGTECEAIGKKTVSFRNSLRNQSHPIIIKEPLFSYILRVEPVQ